MKSPFEKPRRLDTTTTHSRLHEYQEAIEFPLRGDDRLQNLINLIGRCAMLREQMYWYAKFGAQDRPDLRLAISATVAEITRELLPAIIAWDLRKTQN